MQKPVVTRSSQIVTRSQNLGDDQELRKVASMAVGPSASVTQPTFALAIPCTRNILPFSHGHSSGLRELH